MPTAPQVQAIFTYREAVLAEEFQQQLSPTRDLEIVPAHLILSFAHNGGVVLGCFDEGRIVGLLVGFLASDEETPERVVMARLKHWSHLLLVHPDYEGRNLDFSLRSAQRELVIRQGVRLISWADDPLDARSVFLSIRRLGAISRKAQYEEGAGSEGPTMRDDRPYRLLMDWWITSRRVAARVSGSRKPLDLVHFLEAGARVINPSTLRDDNLPTPPNELDFPEGNLVLVEVPPDLDALRAGGRELCHDWRLHIVQVFEHLFRTGYLVVDFVLLGEERIPRAFYLLSRGDATLG